MARREIWRWNSETHKLEKIGSEDYSKPRVYVQDDTMPPTYHHGVCQWFDSKSAFRAATKSIGGYEVGNDKIPPRERKVMSEKAIEKALKTACEIHGYV